MTQDPILDEVRKWRNEYAKQFSYDLRAICLDLKERQEQSERKRFVLPLKRVKPTETR